MKTKKLPWACMALSLALFPACSDDFLDVPQINAVSADTYYRSEDQMRKALNAAYSPLGNRGMYGWWLAPIRNILSDNTVSFEQGLINHHFFSIVNTDIRLFNRKDGDGLWNSLYMGILRANLIIVKMPDSIIPPGTVRNQLLGEAKFLRALYYFHLVNYWGRAPLLADDNFDAIDVAATEAPGLFAAIEQDLTDIIDGNLLPWAYDGGEGREIGRASMGAALSLLGKVQLYQGKHPQAAASFKRVIDQNVYRLIDIERVFTVQGDNSSESVFEVQFLNRNAGFNPFFDDGVNATEITMRNYMLAPNQVGGWENASASPGLVAEFEPGDKRRDAFILMPGDPIPRSTQFYDPARNKGQFGIRKGINSGFAGLYPPAGVGEENFPIIRYADVLLMYAETQINAGNSTATMDLLDQVRARAFGLPSVAQLRTEGKGIADYMRQTGKSLMEALKHERRVELCFECHRYLDLKRWGDLPGNEVLRQRNWNESQRYYPIPQEDIDLSTLLK